jgi:hypothetical protein
MLRFVCLVQEVVDHLSRAQTPLSEVHMVVDRGVVGLFAAELGKMASPYRLKDMTVTSPQAVSGVTTGLFAV